MNQAEIEYLVEILTNSLVKVYYKPGTGDLIPVLSYQSAFLDKDSTAPEPVAWLGGSMQNKCVALYACETNDFMIAMDAARWPKV